MPPRPEPATQSAFRSLPEAHRTIHVPTHPSWLKRSLAFAGPGFLVSVGYMDPGNWGTDLAGGSKYAYTLLWVIFASNLIAQFLQILCARLGLATGKDLAMVCRDHYKRPVAIAMWLLAELAIIACDLAEVVGSAVALNILFHIRLDVGVLITGFDVLLLLGFMRFGFRKIEAIVFTLVMTILVCFLYEIALASPDWAAAAKGTFLPVIPNTDALIIAVGILGATVMPHNLYLHSSIVQTRKVAEGKQAVKEAIGFNTWDTIVALTLAFFVNAAILILAAAVFHKTGTDVEELQQGHMILAAALGPASAVVFAVALLASGQSSTITGTLAGQVVMEGFMHWRIAPWLRRLITRSLAVFPAFFILRASGGQDTVQILLWSQVLLSLQLPFAVFPLITATSNRKEMGERASSRNWTVIGYATGVAIAIANVFLLWLAIGPLWTIAICAAIAAFAAYALFVYKEKPPSAAQTA